MLVGVTAITCILTCKIALTNSKVYEVADAEGIYVGNLVDDKDNQICIPVCPAGDEPVATPIVPYEEPKQTSVQGLW